MIFVLAAATLALAALLLAEAALRLYHRLFLAERFHLPSKRSLFLVHPDISPSLPAEARFFTNSWGERGDEPPRVARLYRGLVLGGSAAECGLLDQDQAWPAQIQSGLQEAVQSGLIPADCAYVGTMSRSGLDVRGLRIALQRLQPFRPPLDFILIHSGPSDFARWIDFGSPPGGAVPALPAHQILNVCRDTRFGLLPKSTALFYYLKRLSAALSPARVEQRKVGRMPVEARKLRAASHPHIPLPAPIQPFLDSYRAGLLDLIAEARLHCRHVFLLPQLWLDPASCSANADPALWFGRFHRMAESSAPPLFIQHSEIERLFRGVYSATVDAAAAAGVHAVDLQGRFPQDLTNFYDDDHFTPAGAALTGRLVAQRIVAIESTPPLPAAAPSPPPFSKPPLDAI
ncbi:MAG: hypothetical protein C0504_16890 [Candidatus Solibacter sp.]|nr:hypothetical protein [Candidatus Solibacter sp.]